MNIDPINYGLRFWSDNIAPCVRDPGGLETLDQLDQVFFFGANGLFYRPRSLMFLTWPRLWLRFPRCPRSCRERQCWCPVMLPSGPLSSCWRRFWRSVGTVGNRLEDQPKIYIYVYVYVYVYIYMDMYMYMYMYMYIYMDMYMYMYMYMVWLFTWISRSILIPGKRMFFSAGDPRFVNNVNQ